MPSPAPTFQMNTSQPLQSVEKTQEEEEEEKHEKRDLLQNK